MANNNNNRLMKVFASFDVVVNAPAAISTKLIFISISSVSWANSTPGQMLYDAFNVYLYIFSYFFCFHYLNIVLMNVSKRIR